jgi:Tol biopolymer transport system component
MGPQWSPDGSKIVYQQRPLDQKSTALGNLFIYDLGTGRNTQVTHLDQSTKTGGWWFMDPSFMPTDHGSAVLFQMPRGTNPQVWDLWSVPVSGGTPAVFQQDAGWGSVDASGRLAYASPVSAATFNGAALYTSGGLSSEPRVRQPLVKVQWSPDGSHIAYVGKDGIYVLDLGSDTATKIVAGGNMDWIDDYTLIVAP